MNGHAPAIALNERGHSAMPRLPSFHRALNDDMLVDILRAHRAAPVVWAAIDVDPPSSPWD